MTRWLEAARKATALGTKPTKLTKPPKPPSGGPETEVLSVLSVLSGAPDIDPDVARDLFEERAAIVEYDAGLPRAEAERLAALAHLSNPTEGD